MQQRKSWNKLAWIVVVLVIAALVARYFLSHDHDASKAVRTVPTVPVRVALAQRGDLDLSLQVIGRAEAYSTVTMQAQVDGRLQSLAFKPGGQVSKGEVIAQIDPRVLQAQVDEALGSLAKDKAQWVNAQASLRRYTPLLAKGYVAKSDYDTVRANAGVYKAAMQADQAAVEMARTQLGYAKIRAPVDSVAGAPLVYPGAQIAANSTGIVVLNQVSPIYLTFSVPESALAGLKASYANGVVAVTAQIPGTSGAPLHATLDFINNAVDTTTGTIQLKARYGNPAHQLTPGQFIKVSLPTARLRQVVTVPSVALQNSPDGNFVFVLGSDNTVQRRMVTVGLSSGDRIVIDKGLSGGEKVITDGQMLLTNGTHVRVVDDHASANGHVAGNG